MLYARCSKAWAAVNNPDYQWSAAAAACACATPVRQEFAEILKIIRARENAYRRKHRAVACSVVGAPDEAKEHEEGRCREWEAEARRRLGLFSADKRAPRVEVPGRLVLLVGSKIVPLWKSLFTKSGRQAKKKGKWRKYYQHIDLLRLEELKEEFNQLLQNIKATKGMITLKQDDHFWDSGPNKRFRLHVFGSAKNGWKLYVEDNVGKRKSGGPRRKSYSSVFAIAILPGGEWKVSGQQVCDALVASVDSGKAVEISSPDKRSNQKSKSKKREKNNKHNARIP